jgi:predicted RNase H-like nuclease (RuvC/YqgF family)
VDLQRQVISLKGKLKQRELLEEENGQLKEEIAGLRAKVAAAEAERRRAKQQEELIRELQAQVSELTGLNKGLREEILLANR